MLYGAAVDNDNIQDAAIIVVNPSNLNIMKGSDFNRLWDEVGNRDKAISAASELGYEAIEYFDYETGDGIEEMEVLVLATEKIKISHVNWVNPEDYPDITEEYL